MSEGNFDSTRKKEVFKIENFTWDSQIFFKVTVPLWLSMIFAIFTGLFFAWVILIYLSIIVYHYLFQKVYIFNEKGVTIFHKHKQKKSQYDSKMINITILPRASGGLHFVKISICNEKKQVILSNRIEITSEEEKQNLRTWTIENQVNVKGSWDELNPDKFKIWFN